MRKLALPAAALAAMTLALGACTSASQDAGSGGAASGSASASAQGFDTSSIAKDDAVAAMVPEAVSSDGKLTVASNLEYAPNEFVAADGRTPVGFDIDIINAVARTMGLEAQIENAGFDSIIPAIGSKYEAGISSFTINPERIQQVNMVSYFTAGSALAVQKGNPDKIKADDVAGTALCGVTVGVQTGTIQQEQLEEVSKTCEAGGNKAIDLLPYDSQADVTTNLAGGKLQAMYADSPIVAYSVEQTNGQVEQLGGIDDAAPYGVVVAKNDPELASAVQAALQKLMDDGTFTQILDAWGQGEGGLSKAEVNPNVG
jgi:polar amino acid transport system substrate-binding protein